MHENEQRPGHDDIDNPIASSPEDAPSVSGSEPVVGDDPEEKRSPEATSKKRSASRVGKQKVPGAPFAPHGAHLVPLFLSGFIALMMTIAFAAGFETIFPNPEAVSSAASEAPEPVEPAPESGGSAVKPVETPAPDEAQDRKPPAAEPATEGSPPPADSKPADSDRSDLRSSLFMGGALAVLSPPAIDGGASGAATGDQRPGPFARLLIFLKFTILVLLGAGCGLLALGGMGLVLKRPMGSIGTAASRMLAAAWLTTLALLVPAPYPWMLDPLHYIVAGTIFWASTMFFFKLNPSQAVTLLGATMALLASTAFGSWIVIWAAWS